MKLSPDLQISLTVAVSEAGRLGHEYAVLEHLLHALTLDDDTAVVLQHAGADVRRVRRRLADYLEEEFETVDVPSSTEPRLSLAVQRVLARAGSQVEGSGREEIRGPDLLVALFAETDSYALQLLEAEGVTRLDVVSFLAHGASKLEPRRLGRRRGSSRPPAEDEPDEPFTRDEGSDFDPDEGDGAVDTDDDAGLADDPLTAFTQELTSLARRGRIDPLIGRETEIRRTLHILQRRRKNNPIYVGDPGVGKTALVEGLARKIAEEDVPEGFRDTVIFRLDMGSLLAGTRYRGDFENRLKGVLAALAEIPGAILFIDEIHTVVGAGSAGRGTMDASNLLKPALQDGTLRLIGATTWEEFRQSFQRDQALARRFQKVEVAEPSLGETVKIFNGLRDRYERHHEVRYTATAIRSAAELAERYLRDRRLPDAALDLLDEAGAAVALKDGKRVGVRDVEQVLATMAQIPARQVRGDDRQRLEGLEEGLKTRVFGQDEALERLVSSIKVARAGLREPDKPVGSFLLTGPTGVGKTEAARQLADLLGVAFLRFDMSEYMERHTVSRLVGAPPGYVGFDRGGLLTEAVSKTPHAVLLLDEIEKAHGDVFNLLLQIMDHGTLTDTNGKPTDFRHVIVLMTSNVGARELAQRTPGFTEDADHEAGQKATESDRAVERLFAPEFRNRLDARLQFQALTPRVMERIVDKFIDELSAQLAEKKVRIELTDAARKVLAEKGHDPKFGARPLSRVIEEEIKRPLTDEILFGRLEKGGQVTVDAPSSSDPTDFLLLRFATES